jgi:Ser/Thr protein kinase RdoA (MazF antagonist)
MLATILEQYGLTASQCRILPFGTGLINSTWKISDANNNNYILQKINGHVFTNPVHISENIGALADYFDKHDPYYLFVKPVITLKDGVGYVIQENNYYRLFPFITASKTYDTVATPQLAFEAARQFGKFTRELAGFDASSLHITIPDFHNLTLRYRQFEEAEVLGNPQRIAQSRDLINFIQSQQDIVTAYEKYTSSGSFRQRVTHHDTKISNVLFDGNDKGLCVIDLDTVMPGYFISDVGDMMRTYLSPANEEETDFDKISIRDEIFYAIAGGYLGEMQDELTATEVSHFVFAGKFMIYMQAIRFLVDHLNNDVYYGARYDGHNFNRAGNQVTLLQQLLLKEKMFSDFVNAKLYMQAP